MRSRDPRRESRQLGRGVRGGLRRGADPQLWHLRHYRADRCGKTTLLDAICLALFDRLPRMDTRGKGRRLGASMATAAAGQIRRRAGFFVMAPAPAMPKSTSSDRTGGGIAPVGRSIVPAAGSTAGC
jgi:hypothetical protein